MKWIPDAKDTALSAAIAGLRAHRYSKQAAEMGVEPNLASQYGQTVANTGYWLWRYWLATATVMFAIGVFVFQDLFPIWFIGHVASMWILWRRYKTFRDTDPRKRLRYGIGTGWIVAFLFAWFLVMFPAVIATQIVIPALGDRPQPTVVTVPVGDTNQGVDPTASNPYGEGY